MEFKELKIGMKGNVSKTITESDVTMYSGISLDINPVHLNEEYAKETMFKKRIAHGMISAGLISATLGTKLPGEGTIYLGQELKFVAPVYLGETIIAEVEIIKILEEKNIIILKTICKNQSGKIVVSGEAKVMKK